MGLSIRLNAVKASIPEKLIWLDLKMSYIAVYSRALVMVSLVSQSLAESFYTEPPILPLSPSGALVTQFCSLIFSVFFYITHVG
uniref:Uncharacterized protein n=1 Tax=Pyxicephalus adspersus TaxID=30357 RepID=A0AAV2ZVC7_PYXAD|nr:TPA: hypothetical protein GDO54_017425 [Pyxicephalus adspersus]